MLRPHHTPSHLSTFPTTECNLVGQSWGPAIGPGAFGEMVGSVRVQGRGQHRRLVVSLEDLESSADEEEQLRMVWALPASA